ncbi:MAG: hypothetical protein ACAH65_09725 [Chloroflexota bacterium]
MSPTKAKRSSGETATCPWCSATVPVEASTCPSCGASLRDAAEGEVLGVTQVDPAAAARTKRIKTRRLASWLGTDAQDDDESVGKVEPPTDEVRQEMLRLELAAIDAEIEAKRTAAEAQRALALEDPKAKPG